MSLTEHLMDALPTLEQLHADGWTVKLTLLAEQSTREPLPYVATLWRSGLDQGIRGYGHTLTEALEAAQRAVVWTLRQGQTRWMGESQ